MEGTKSPDLNHLTPQQTPRAQPWPLARLAGAALQREDTVLGPAPPRAFPHQLLLEARPHLEPHMQRKVFGSRDDGNGHLCSTPLTGSPSMIQMQLPLSVFMRGYDRPPLSKMREPIKLVNHAISSRPEHWDICLPFWDPC